MVSWQTYYRPQKLADLHLQSVREQMVKLTQNGTLPQVLLFTGPKGTGKTSTARIIAAMLNTKANHEAIKRLYLQKKTATKKDHLVDPDLKDSEVVKILQGNSYVVVEIDAASHRGIDEVRSLQEQIYLPPALGQVMVYIFDEVHMFTSEAFNALLKVLEEPPAHAFFILATTEAHKIPPTVASRCQVINFKQASESELLAAFEKILAAEKLTAEKAALSEIASLAEGSFRDGVKYLQLVSSSGEINQATVVRVLRGNQEQASEDLVALIVAKNALGLTEFFGQLRQQNWEEKFFLKNFSQYLYNQLLLSFKPKSKAKISGAQARFLLDLLLHLPPSMGQPFLSLELALLDVVVRAGKK